MVQEGGITYQELQLDWRFSIFQLAEMNLKSDTGEHSRLRFSCVVEESQGEKIILQVASQEPVSLINKSSGAIYFKGFIQEIHLKVVQNINYIEINAISYSYLMDIEKKERSFQNVAQTYESILNEVVRAYPNGHFLSKMELRMEMGRIAVQYVETDWEFLKRLFSRLSAVLIPEMTGESVRFWVGLGDGKMIPARHVNYRLKKDLASFREATKQFKQSFVEYDFVMCEFTSVQYYKIGDCLEIAGQVYYISSVDASLIDSMLEFTYIARKKQAIRQELIRNEQLVGAAIEGTVIDVVNNVVKLHLDIDKKQDVGTAKWFGFAAEGNNTFYYMPQLGARGKLYFPSMDEAEAMAIQSIRVAPSSPKEKAKSDKTMANPAVKSFGTDLGKEIRLEEDGIKFTANKNMLYMMANDKDGITIETDKSTMIHSDTEIQYVAKYINIEGSESVDLRIDSGSFMSLEKDLQISSSVIHVKGTTQKPMPQKENPKAKEADGGWLDLVQGSLAIAGFVPGIGMFADILNAGISLARGNYMDAAINLVAAVPLAGDALKAASMAAKASKVGKVALKAAKTETRVGKALRALNKVVTLVKTMANTAKKWLGIMVRIEAKMMGLMKKGLSKLLTKLNTGILKRGKFGKNKWVQKLSDRLCKHGFEPVDLVSGAMVYDNTDFVYPGTIPFDWSWRWGSTATNVGALGHGVQFKYDTYLDLDIDEHAIVAILTDGRGAVFPELLVGQKEYNRREKLWLERMEDEYRLFDTQESLTYHYKPRRKSETEFALVRISNDTIYTIDFMYDANDWLTQVEDSANRVFTVSHYPTGQIQDVTFEGETTRKKLVSYTYNEVQDLTSFTDALGQSSRMKYRNHLMYQRVDRDNLSFYWDYDVSGRVLHTWGDGGVLEGFITYHDELGYNEVKNSVGAVTEYHYDADNLIVKIVHPNDGVETFAYDEDFCMTEATDVLEKTTRYQYDAYGFLQKVNYANGTSEQFVYDAYGKLVSVTDATRALTTNEYNAQEQLVRTLDQDGNAVQFRYDDAGFVTEIENPLGEVTQLRYDDVGNLGMMVLADGSSEKWEYNEEGNCITATNPLGGKQTFDYDDLMRLVKTETPEGNKIRMDYDEYGNVLKLRDNQKEVRYDYSILGKMTMVEQDGRRVKMQYDNEEQLVEIVNEVGDRYQLEYDLEGNITQEVFFNGMERSYIRDVAGRLMQINRPEERFTRFLYHETGELGNIEYSDGTWVGYEYDSSGQLVKLGNADAMTEFEWNAQGLVSKESQSGHEVMSEYDVLGRRTRVTSSLGADFTQHYDSVGNLMAVQAMQNDEAVWKMALAHNEIGQELERVLPGELKQKRRYDVAGRMIEDSARVGSRRLQHRSYQWDIDGQLKQVHQMLTNKHHAFDYDQFGNVVKATYGVAEEVNRQADATNNYFETFSKTDRVYGKNGELLQKDGTDYRYDGEGNLIAKEMTNGDLWEYAYFGNGLLKEVARPDGGVVRFVYDALGRRIRKEIMEGATTEFVWDGQTLLHEWQVNATDDVTTWLFEDGALTPSAKMTANGNYSILSNYLGVPEEAYDSEGNLVWSMALDIYGRVQAFEGERDFVPFRFPGQYEDAETELYYNRFRYYDPEQGNYTQVDPIGLAGGNPTLYGYVQNSIIQLDLLGLKLKDLTGKDSTGRPLSSSLYSILYETGISEKVQSIKRRGPHNRDANEQLYEHLEKYPDLKELFPKEIVNHVQPGPRGGFKHTSPPGYTWHHNNPNYTRIELVPWGQHNAPGSVQKNLHKDRKGGFSQLSKKKC
ncbi:RHS repeat-associated core domain-containing protein [Listeria goaensis]|uniref:RHS repeat-associated core domain-containing protein n=1 Tax=Listeria goaensis TaxID=1649188 RepID=UPI000B58C14F|nr:RHS repeat-associated core domain-containing protein [Listeria goaensis]